MKMCHSSPSQALIHQFGFLAIAGLALAMLSGCAGSSSAAGATPTVHAARSTSTARSSSRTSSRSSIRWSTSSAPLASVDRLAEQATNAVGPAVVRVQDNKGLGSGVILTSDGYIVTNDHVVSGAKNFVVTLANGHSLSAKVAGTDAVDDLAVVKVNANNLPTATLGDPSKLAVGETVLAVGNPLGYNRTVTEGIVSALNRTIAEGQNSPGRIPDAIQTSAAINPGNSGGALIDLAGQVVGIPTASAVDPEFNAPAPGIGFAIPASKVRSIAQQIIQYGKVKHTGQAALGILAESVDSTIAQTYNLPVNHGVLVVSDIKGGPAAKAGIHKGDIIVKVGSTSISSQSDLVNVMAQRHPGDKVSVEVVTPSGSHHTDQVTLGELPANANG